MGDHPSTREPSKDFDFGMLPADGTPVDPWNDPADRRARMYRQLLRYQAGFLVLGCALMIACVTQIGILIGDHLRLIPILQLIIQWEFVESTLIVLGSLTGVALLWGHWPDEGWRRRSGLLLLLCLVDLVSWSVENATRLGITDVAFGHDYFREALGTAIGWSEFALIASLAAEMAGSLGEAHAAELGRAARSLTTLTALIWLVYFFVGTNWNPPVWPLKPFGRNFLTMNLFRCWYMLYAILLVHVTLLCLSAARSCGRAVRQMGAEDRASEAFHSPSERGWQELQGESAADFDPWEAPRKS